MGSLAARRARDLRDALTTIPGWRTWRTCALAYVVFLVCAAPIGLASGLLQPQVAHLRPGEFVSAGVLLLVQPAFVEELVFRALLLPRDARSMRDSRVVLVAGAALALYVASHPLNAWLFRPQVLSLFASPAYLTLATLLGLTCTVTYFISRSIWPPVAVHWLAVVTWIWLLGGQALLC
jgi:predicted Abi (CAAX) family protease